jgi:hypothetical protein
MAIKHLKTGSSLFEFVIYMAIGITLLQVSSLWVEHVYAPFSRTCATISTVATLASAEMVFFHDICAAPSAVELWKKRDTHELIWSTPTIDIGWLYHDQTLKRIEGRYDTATHGWLASTTSVMGQGVKHASFTLSVLDNRIITASLAYTVDNKTTQTKVVGLRNRLENGIAS